MTGSAIALAVLIILVVFAPYFAPQNPYDLANLSLMDGRLAPRQALMDGSIAWLGTDDQGRDMLSAILYGLRISLMVGLSAVVLATAVGGAVGLVAAYMGGVVDTILMRIVDFILGFPTILVALVLLVVMGRGVDKVILALVLVQWGHYARIMRGRALQERRKEYAEAAANLGFRPGASWPSTCCRTAWARSWCSPPSRSRPRSRWKPRCPSWAWACPSPSRRWAC